MLIVIEKIFPENAFEQKKKKPVSTFNLGLVLKGLRTTGPRSTILDRIKWNSKPASPQINNNNNKFIQNYHFYTLPIKIQYLKDN